MNKKIARIAMFAAAAVMAFALCFGLTACGNSKEDNEKLIRDSIAAEFQDIKSLDSATMKELVSGVEKETDLSIFGITTEQFLQAWFDGFDYKINSVNVEDKAAKVSVDLTIKDFSAVMTDWMASINALSSDTEFLSQFAGKSMEEVEKGIYQKAGALLIDSFAKASMKTTTVELPYKLNDKTWEPAADFGEIFGEAFLGDLSGLNM